MLKWSRSMWKRWVLEAIVGGNQEGCLLHFETFDVIVAASCECLVDPAGGRRAGLSAGAAGAAGAVAGAAAGRRRAVVATAASRPQRQPVQLARQAALPPLKAHACFTDMT